MFSIYAVCYVHVSRVKNEPYYFFDLIYLYLSMKISLIVSLLKVNLIELYPSILYKFACIKVLFFCDATLKTLWNVLNFTLS